MSECHTPFYRRNRLEPEARERYDLLVEALRRRDEDLPGGVGPEDWPAVSDHPELFWVKTCMSSNGGPWQIVYFDLTDQDIAREQVLIDRKVEVLLDQMPENGSEWEKALYLYEAFVRLIHYQEDEEGLALAGFDEDGTWRYGHDFSRTICGPLGHSYGVCLGIALSFQYLLQRVGIECTTVVNNVEGTKHAWNLARIDGSYCYLDATWGRGWSVDRDDQFVYVAHDFFGMSADDLALVDKYVIAAAMPMPEHVGSEHDWFRRTGWYVGEFDPRLVATLVERARGEGLQVLELKCSSAPVWELVAQRLELEHGLTCYRHRLNVLAAPLAGRPTLPHLDEAGELEL